MHLLTCLGEQYGALVSFKDGKLVFAERNAGISGSGQAMAALVINRPDLVAGSCHVCFADRGKQKRKEVEIESDEVASASYSLPEAYASEDEAKKAAKAKVREQQAGSDTIEFSVIGNLDLKVTVLFK